MTSLDTRKKRLRLDNGSEVSYDKCLLATGGTPKTLPLFQKKGPFSTFRTVSVLNDYYMQWVPLKLNPQHNTACTLALIVKNVFFLVYY